MDNCPADPNANQADTDGDGIGDVCDPTPIPGEVTGDCAVTVLDMIALRNHLYGEISGDNARYDLTGDGYITVLDMIVVRNHLYTLCQ